MNLLSSTNARSFVLILLAVLFILLCISYAVRAGEAEQEGPLPRPEMRQGLLPNQMRWFMGLEDVNAEKERHQLAVKEITGEAHALIKELVAKEREKTEASEAIDRDALHAEIQDKVTEVGGKIIDEQIRHQKAMTALLELHRNDAIEDFKNSLKQQRQRRNARNQENRQARPRPGINSEEFEGAVF
ncbi:MAG: hypothetical protein JXA52_02450 [Planctomycetes bacterium]|nr:hypothetical protein [Planctomycetota bacterium]